MSQDRVDLIGMARNPVPHGARPGFLRGPGRQAVRYALWQATAAPTRGTVCLFQGQGEFIEKYFETVTDLRRRGFAVATFDWPGQGGSSRSGADGFWRYSFGRHEEVLRRFMVEVVLPDCPPPFFALAHSMGANVVLRQTRASRPFWERLVLTSPLVSFSGYEGQMKKVRTIAGLAKALGFGSLALGTAFRGGWEVGAFENNPLTSDRLRFERTKDVLRAAPHFSPDEPRLGWVAAASASMCMVDDPRFAAKIKLPVLVVAAGNDRIVSTPAIERFASQVKNCKPLVIAGARHEILQERDEFREQFWAAFDAFVPGIRLAPTRAVGVADVA